MKRLLLLLFAMTALLMFAAACTSGDDDATPDPTDTPSATATPTATESPAPTPTDTPDGNGGGVTVGPPEVTANGPAGSTPLGEGTYCWSDGGVGLCADKIGLITGVQPLVVSPGSRIDLRGDLDWVGASQIAVTIEKRPPVLDSGPDWVAFLPESPSDLQTVVSMDGASFSLPNEAGAWLVSLWVVEERGDANFGLLVTTVGDPPALDRTPLGFEARMAFGARLAVEGTPFAVSLLAIDGDNRCPIDAVCIVAGETSVQIAVTAEGASEVHRVTIPNGGEATIDLDARYQLRVVEVAPAARSSVQLAPEDYVLTIVVERVDVASSGSGVRGVVTSGPACPVQREDMQCPDHPLAATMIVRDGGGNEVATIESSADGWYELELEPGSYTLDPQSPPGLPFPVGSPVDFEVVSGAWTTLDVGYDSGIR